MKFKKLIIILSLLILALAFLNLTTWVKSKKPENNSVGSGQKIDFPEVRGDSLFPLIKPGQTIKLVHDYYDNRPAERGDIIAYNYAGDTAPIIKIVKAIPGDKWHLEKGNSQDGYRIIINDQPIKNSEGEFYLIPEAKIKMLEIYVQGYPIIPENTYLILGNQTAGTLDATQFGLISKSDILGKIEIVN